MEPVNEICQLGSSPSCRVSAVLSAGVLLTHFGSTLTFLGSSPVPVRPHVTQAVIRVFTSPCSLLDYVASLGHVDTGCGDRASTLSPTD
ncbi:hypothetical protein J6590_000988 [Homalodisca vitripennis]|nr:hypothetical protein J6590_000988 [Homalodisca vitripennis]